MKCNNYSDLFHEDMNSGELRTIFFSVGKELSFEEKKKLCDAYLPVSKKVLDRELDEAAKYGIMTSY